ncbi:hypothetical protein Tco_1432937 [Tanacetum coccineum]
MIPQAVLIRSGLKTINTARSRAVVNVAKPKAVHNVVKRNRGGMSMNQSLILMLLVTTTGAEISTASPEVKTTGDSIEDIAAETLVYIRRSTVKAKDKGKAKMEDSESAMIKTKRQQE